MGLFDNIRARRAARRAEKGREVFAQNALFDNTMSSLYGKDWRGNAQINNDRMRQQFAANKNLFLQEAAKRAEANRPEPTSPNVPLPGQAVTQRLDDAATIDNAPSPVMGNINAEIQRFGQKAAKVASDRKWWLNEANSRLANLSKELGYDLGKVDSIDDVTAIQKYLGVATDGKFGKNTYQAMRDMYNNGGFGHVGKPYTHEIDRGGGQVRETSVDPRTLPLDISGAFKSHSAYKALSPDEIKSKGGVRRGRWNYEMNNYRYYAPEYAGFGQGYYYYNNQRIQPNEVPEDVRRVFNDMSLYDK